MDFLNYFSLVTGFRHPACESSSRLVQPCLNSATQLYTVVSEGEESLYTSSNCPWNCFVFTHSKNKNSITA